MPKAKRTKKSNHSKKEDFLREEIIGLLRKNKYIEERVYPFHGSNEYGIDVMVLKLDMFNRLKAYGIQIKTGDITCSDKGPNNDISKIIGQISVAFGKEFPVGSSAKYKLDGFYILTDGIINQNARYYISSAQVGFRHLDFIDEQDLEELRANSKKFEET